MLQETPMVDATGQAFPQFSKLARKHADVLYQFTSRTAVRCLHGCLHPHWHLRTPADLFFCVLGTQGWATFCFAYYSGECVSLVELADVPLCQAVDRGLVYAFQQVVDNPDIALGTVFDSLGQPWCALQEEFAGKLAERLLGKAPD